MMMEEETERSDGGFFFTFFPIHIFYGSCFYILYRNDVKEDLMQVACGKTNNAFIKIVGSELHVQILWTSYMYYECITRFESLESQSLSEVC